MNNFFNKIRSKFNKLNYLQQYGILSGVYFCSANICVAWNCILTTQNNPQMNYAEYTRNTLKEKLCHIALVSIFWPIHATQHFILLVLPYSVHHVYKITH